MPVYRFHVEMTCGGCVGSVNNVLKKKLGDDAKFQINLDEKIVEIDSELPESQLKEILVKTEASIAYYGMSDIEQMIRTRQVQDAALAEINEKIASCKGTLDNFNHLSERVTTLPEKLSYEIMVEFGKNAFMPGKLVHTNELMVHLGDAYFASVTCKQALKIIKLRRENLESTLTDLEKVAENIAKKTEYIGKMENNDLEEGFEIREECSEPYQHPKDRRRISRVKETTDKQTIPKNVPPKDHSALMERLDQWQRLEEEEDVADRLSEASDESSGASSKKAVKKVRFEDNESLEEPYTIRFRHSEVKPIKTNDMTPGDVYKLISKQTSGEATESQSTIADTIAVSDSIVERPTTSTETHKNTPNLVSSKPVSKFKASRMKQQR